MIGLLFFNTQYEKEAQYCLGEAKCFRSKWKARRNIYLTWNAVIYFNQHTGSAALCTNNLAIFSFTYFVTHTWRLSIMCQSINCLGQAKRCTTQPDEASPQWWSDRSTTTHIVLLSVLTQLGLGRKLYNCLLHHFTTSHCILKCALLTFSSASNRLAETWKGDFRPPVYG